MVSGIIGAVGISTGLILLATALAHLAIRDRVTEAFWWMIAAAGLLFVCVAVLAAVVS